MKSFFTSLAFVLILCEERAHPATINFNTSAPGNWTVTGGGAVNATPYIVTTNVFPGQGMPGFTTTGISLTSTAETNGTFVSGGSFANFTGFWTADFRFFLPSDASAVSLVYSNLYADDRTVLMLNGTPIASAGIIAGHNNPTGGPDGFMTFSQGGALVNWTFPGPDGSVSGTTTSGFVLGGFNTLEAVINNTHTGIYGATDTFGGGPNDQTILALSGAISFVPEPSGFAVAMLGLACFRLKTWRARRRIRSPASPVRCRQAVRNFVRGR